MLTQKKEKNIRKTKPHLKRVLFAKLFVFIFFVRVKTRKQKERNKKIAGNDVWVIIIDRVASVHHSRETTMTHMAATNTPKRDEFCAKEIYNCENSGRMTWMFIVFERFFFSPI